MKSEGAGCLSKTGQGLELRCGEQCQHAREDETVKDGKEWGGVIREKKHEGKHEIRAHTRDP